MQYTIISYRADTMELSPSHSPPPPDASSEEEEDIDLPAFGTAPSLKVQKLDTPESPISFSTAAAAPGPSHVTSLPRALTFPQQQEQPSQSVAAERPKNPTPPKKHLVKMEDLQSYAHLEELRNLSPLKLSGPKASYESRKAARKVQKLSKTLKEKSEIEKKVSCWS